MIHGLCEEYVFKGVASEAQTHERVVCIEKEQ